MSKYFQWFLALVSMAVAVIIIGFGIAGIAVAIGFLMLPAGIFYIVRGISNQIHKTNTVITIDVNQRHQFILNPILEIAIGVLLLIIGINLTEAFIGIVLTGIAIFFIVYFLDKYFGRS